MSQIKTLARGSIFWPPYSLKPFFLFSKTLGQIIARFYKLKKPLFVDGTEARTKRRCRTPLTELQEENGNRKRVKVEGEVKELGRILKQHLGSVAAAKQPCRTQWTQ